MSILQVEVSEETRQLMEAQARQEGRDTQSWVTELVEEAVRTRQREQDARRETLERLLQEALDSGEGQVADDAWWKKLEGDVMADLQKRDKA